MYCDEELIEEDTFNTYDHQLEVDFLPQQIAIVIKSFAVNVDEGYTTERNYEIPMNYCPNCGRKLNGVQ